MRQCQSRTDFTTDRLLNKHSWAKYDTTHKSSQYSILSSHLGHFSGDYACISALTGCFPLKFFTRPTTEIFRKVCESLRL